MKGQRERSKLIQKQILKTPVSRPITQLTVSPSGDFIAILTSHTCHVAILPAPSHLRSGDPSPLRLKTFQLGPTAHVLEQASLVSAIWHPLSPHGHCLVTVTKDSCVRLWELDKDNRSSFDEPALAVDLKKLVNASSSQADLSASKYGASKGFSPENETMIAAAACFGGQGFDEEHGWSSMTLWVAMTEGDVYALCPFLPSQWRAPTTMLPTLTTSVVAKTRALHGGERVSESERRVCDQQCRWLAEVDAQDPQLMPGDGDFDMIEVYSRPERPGAIPKLQGPFYLADGLDVGDVTDIYVIAPKIDDDALDDDAEYDDRDASEGLSVGVVCLATSTSKVYVCLDINGVEAAWLPTKRSRGLALVENADDQELLLLEIIDLGVSGSEQENWPTFTSSPSDRYELFTTQPGGVYGLSFGGWVGRLEDELASVSQAGIGFRMDVLLESARTTIDYPIKLPAGETSSPDATVAILDPNLGHFLLTSTNNVPFSAILDIPTYAHPYAPDDYEPTGLLAAPEPRAPYHPDEIFFQPSRLPQLIKAATDRKLLGTDLKAQVRFSPATLKLMEDAHRLLGDETLKLGLAAADLFRRCERMRAELREQVRRVAEIADKVHNVVGDDEEEEEESEGEREGTAVGKRKIETRIQQTQERTRGLNERVEALRKRMSLLGGRQLSAKEAAFAHEVQNLRLDVLARPDDVDDEKKPEAPTDPGALVHMDNSPAARERRVQREREQRRVEEEDYDDDDGAGSSLASRFDAVRSLHERLRREVDEASAEASQKMGSGGTGTGNGMTGVSSDYRRRKLTQVFGLLERETALVEAVAERLGRLSGRGG